VPNRKTLISKISVQLVDLFKTSNNQSLQVELWCYARIEINVQGIVMRAVFGVVFAAGYVMLMYDLLTIGKRRVAISSPKARVAGGRA